jgi:hypothetical protein
LKGAEARLGCCAELGHVRPGGVCCARTHEESQLLPLRNRLASTRDECDSEVRWERS